MATLQDLRQIHPEHGSPWTDSLRRLVARRYRKGWSIEYIAHHYGRSPAAIGYQLESLGVLGQSRRRLSKLNTRVALFVTKDGKPILARKAHCH